MARPDMMARRLLLACAACGLALAFSTFSSQAQNLLLDPGFESGGANTPWALSLGASFSKEHARTGSWSMENSGTSTGAQPVESSAVQTLVTTAGIAYDLTGYGFTAVAPAGGINYGFLQINFWSGPNGTGSNLLTQTSNQINSSSPTGAWIALDTGNVTAPAGSQSMQVLTAVAAQGTTTTVYFDDLSLVQVPEPGSLALSGVGGLALAAGLRRSHHFHAKRKS